MNTRVRIVQCVQCRKTAAELNIPRLLSCGACNVTVYCGRACQKAHWSVHKIFCAAWAANNNSFAAIFRAFMTQHPIYSVTTRLQNLETYIEKPFTKFDEGTFLHDRAKRDVFKLLIDSFRLRQDDEATMEGKTTPNSIYTGATSSIVPFRHYLFEAAIIPNFLPPWWWDTDSKRECETFGESGEWTDIDRLRKDLVRIENFDPEKRTAV